MQLPALRFHIYTQGRYGYTQEHSLSTPVGVYSIITKLPNVQVMLRLISMRTLSDLHTTLPSV
jgi:hypothetical protein